MSDVPLSEYAMLSDCRSAALVSASGSVDWLCLPRFDSSPLFARLLDEEAGHFVVAPADPAFKSRWRYRRPGLVLETTWAGPSGELVVTDALALGRKERGHDLGHESPGVLLRRVRCTAGAVAVYVDFTPRPEAGLIHPRLDRDEGGVVSSGGASTLMLSTDADLTLDAAGAHATVDLGEGEDLTFALQQTDAWGAQPSGWSARQVRRRLEDTEHAWRSWSELHQNYEGPLREQVHHSGVVLQGLTYAPSGAVVAAPTTSLPEGVGSGRTWDYRFTWLRDASMTMQGLWVAACPDEAIGYFAFLARAAGTELDRGGDLQIMFGIDGTRDLTERELPHLSGWRGSGPVRVGNDAWSQRQIDVYGAVLDAAYLLKDQLVPLDEPTRRFLVSLVETAAQCWRDDDQGLWEMRGPARPYLHGKLMCWVALDRGLAMAEDLAAEDRVEQWTAAHAEVAAAILEGGWSETVGAYAQCLGSDELDASVLMMAIVGFLPPDDERLLSTIDAIERGLSDERGLLYRYLGDDGFDEPEGSFLLCTFWLAHALAITGQTQRARDVLERAASYATGLGLMSEQVDESSGELLGNYPQAFSHLGLVTAANALAEAERAAPGAHGAPST